MHVDLPERIKIAREHGDLRENSEFKAAKERQAFVEARLNHLTTRMTELSKIDVTDMAYDKVGFGSVVPISDSEFLITEAQPPITDPTVRFTKSEEATLMTVELAGNPISAARVARREDDADRLAAWIGSYRSDELAATAIIEGVVESGALTYLIGSTPPREPIARADWTLSLPGMSAKGELGTDGKIDAFVVHAGRVRGIRFDRAPP